MAVCFLLNRDGNAAQLNVAYLRQFNLENSYPSFLNSFCEIICQRSIKATLCMWLHLRL